MHGNAKRLWTGQPVPRLWSVRMTVVSSVVDDPERTQARRTYVQPRPEGVSARADADDPRANWISTCSTVPGHLRQRHQNPCPGPNEKTNLAGGVRTGRAHWGGLQRFWAGGSPGLVFPPDLIAKFWPKASTRRVAFLRGLTRYRQPMQQIIRSHLAHHCPVGTVLHAHARKKLREDTMPIPQKYMSRTRRWVQENRITRTYSRAYYQKNGAGSMTEVERMVQQSLAGIMKYAETRTVAAVHRPPTQAQPDPLRWRCITSLSYSAPIHSSSICPRCIKFQESKQ